jgi:MFS transporter, OFA family, oxalate/formate antiporter
VLDNQCREWVVGLALQLDPGLHACHAGMMRKRVADRSLQSSPRVFYGWFGVAGGFAVTFVGFGNAYTFSAFIGSLQRDFAASRGSVSLVFSVAGFLYFALGLVSGPLADRFGARLLAVVGMILTGLGLAAASVARSLPEVYAAYGLGVGLGIGFSYVPILGAVQRWFVRRRGLASGLAVSGIGVGTLVMPPAAALLIDAMGWRGAYLVLGCFAAIVGGGMALWSKTIRAVAARGPTAIRRFLMCSPHSP